MLKLQSREVKFFLMGRLRRQTVHVLRFLNIIAIHFAFLYLKKLNPQIEIKANKDRGKKTFQPHVVVTF